MKMKFNCLFLIALFASFSCVNGILYQVSRYYGNIDCSGVPDSVAELESDVCYDFSTFFGMPIINPHHPDEHDFAGGVRVICFDQPNQESGDSGAYTTFFDPNNKRAIGGCFEPLHETRRIQPDGSTYYQLYTSEVQYGCVRMLCLANPPKCPLDSSRRLLEETEHVNIVAINVSVTVQLNAGVKPSTWLTKIFSQQDLSNPWFAMDNDVLSISNAVNITASVSTRNLRSLFSCEKFAQRCLAGDFAIDFVGGLKMTGDLAAFVGGTVVDTVAQGFGLTCIVGDIGLSNRGMKCILSNPTSSSRRQLSDNFQMTSFDYDNTLAVTTNFSLSFQYSMATSLDDALAMQLFNDYWTNATIESLPAFRFAILLSKGKPSDFVAVTDSIATFPGTFNRTISPENKSKSDDTIPFIGPLNFIVVVFIICVVGVVVLSILIGLYVYCRHRHKKRTKEYSNIYGSTELGITVPTNEGTSL